MFFLPLKPGSLQKAEMYLLQYTSPLPFEGHTLNYTSEVNEQSEPQLYVQRC